MAELQPEVMRALRDKYRVSARRTCEAFRTLATQLAAAPAAPEVVEALRRELHRVRGTAGSYGFHEASSLAGKLEDRAVRWAGDTGLDRPERSAMIAQFAEVLEMAVGEPGVEAAGAPPTKPIDLTPVAVPSDAGMIAGTLVPDVFVIEDDGPLQEMILYALRAGGFSTKAYASGPEALEALRAMPAPADGKRPVVLLDVDLPGMDGHSLHERLRVERPGVYGFVFQTVHAGEAEQVRALKSGALDYIIKPLNLRVLLAKMPRWIGQTESTA